MKILQSFIMLMIITIFAPGLVFSAGRQAIIIGVDQYPENSQIPPLIHCAEEAQNLSLMLSKNGYGCRLMVNGDATKERLSETFIQLEQQMVRTGELDLLLFYFSGRGTRIPDDIQADETQDGMDECILLSDAAADTPRSYVRDDALAHWVSAIQSKQVVIVMDCSFWGEADDASVKGFGNLPKADKLDAVELSDGLPSETLIISSSFPDAPAKDGIFAAKLLESCVTEEADRTGDRIISLAEVYEYVSGRIQSQQPIRMVGSKASDITFVSLPPLSSVSIESNPPGAEIQVYKGLQQLTVGENAPATVPLKQGMYKINVQKPGFFIPEPRNISIAEYDKIYVMEPFQLKPIIVAGQVKTINSSSEPVPIADGTLKLHVKYNASEIHQEQVSTDGRFNFETKTNQWLKVGDEYEISVTGQPVATYKPVKFTYDGYTDIQVSITVTLDTIPPALSRNGIALQTDRLVVGGEIQGTISAQDDGLGLSDTIDIQLHGPGEQQPFSISSSDISFQTPGTYQFRYTLPMETSAAGEWRLSGLRLYDRAGNETYISGDKLNAKFSVFVSRYALGKQYFGDGNYAKALAHLKQISPPDDNSKYLMALAYYYQSEPAKALDMFQSIEAKTDYLGKARNADMPQMPRQMVNKIWGNMLNGLNSHKKDAGYLLILAAAGEELGRDYEAKIYAEQAKRLRGQ